jgi:type I restriction enzyme S subunit
MNVRKTYNLSDICRFVTSRTCNIENYISTENMLPNKGGITSPSNIPSGSAIAYQLGDVLISNIRPYFQKIWQANCDGACSADVLCIRANEKADCKYLYYLLSQQKFFDYVMSGAKGCKMPRGDKSQIMQWQISLPPLAEQKRIADILSVIDDKIELNRRINANLEQQAQALSDEYFIHNIGKLGNYSTASLTDIAQFLNGLAMQKFRPKGNEDGIPVLKIKELGQGKCDASSDLCSSSIPEEYIINNGDIVFSWSGTLLVDIWCSGICGLNQHLFKVSPLSYPKWLIYFWTKYHLSNFIRIAQDKAVTMGHIKRGDLDAAKVIIPSAESLNELDKIMSPMLQSIISNRIENNNLSILRDTLLPKLMSGEITV